MFFSMIEVDFYKLVGDYEIQLEDGICKFL